MADTGGTRLRKRTEKLAKNAKADAAAVKEDAPKKESKIGIARWLVNVVGTVAIGALLYRPLEKVRGGVITCVASVNAGSLQYYADWSDHLGLTSPQRFDDLNGGSANLVADVEKRDAVVKAFQVRLYRLGVLLSSYNAFSGHGMHMVCSVHCFNLYLHADA